LKSSQFNERLLDHYGVPYKYVNIHLTGAFIDTLNEDYVRHRGDVNKNVRSELLNIPFPVQQILFGGENAYATVSSDYVSSNEDDIIVTDRITKNQILLRLYKV
jgi:hypothetical protein